MLVKPLDVLGKVRDAQMVPARANLVRQAVGTPHKFIGAPNDIELLINIRKPTGTVKMIALAALHQQRSWSDK